PLLAWCILTTMDASQLQSLVSVISTFKPPPPEQDLDLRQKAVIVIMNDDQLSAAYELRTRANKYVASRQARWAPIKRAGQALHKMLVDAEREEIAPAEATVEA